MFWSGRRVLIRTNVPWRHKSSYSVSFSSLWQRPVSHDTTYIGFLERSSGSPSIGVQILSWWCPLCLWWMRHPIGVGYGRMKRPNCNVRGSVIWVFLVPIYSTSTLTDFVMKKLSTTSHLPLCCLAGCSTLRYGLSLDGVLRLFSASSIISLQALTNLMVL